MQALGPTCVFVANGKLERSICRRKALLFIVPPAEASFLVVDFDESTEI